MGIMGPFPDTSECGERLVRVHFTARPEGRVNLDERKRNNNKRGGGGEKKKKERKKAGIRAELSGPKPQIKI